MEEVVVNVESLQIDQDGSQEEISFTTDGELYNKELGYYLRYDDDIISDKQVTTTLKIKEQMVTLIRDGAVRMKQEFKLEERTSFGYQTPYGKLQFDLEVQEMEIEAGRKQGRIELKYQLENEDRLVNQNHLIITYKEDLNV
ncbi:MAG: DUF1934 domain-containing protein [Bacillota bacterium]